MEHKQIKQTVLVVLVLGTLLSAQAYAGADSSFSGPVNTLTSWLTGSLGKLFSIGALAVGLGIGIVKQSVMSVAVGTGIALATTAGPTVMSTIVTATL